VPPVEAAPGRGSRGLHGGTGPAAERRDGALSSSGSGSQAVSTEARNADCPPVQASRRRGAGRHDRRVGLGWAGARRWAPDAAQGVQQYSLLAGRSGARGLAAVEGLDRRRVAIL